MLLLLHLDLLFHPYQCMVSSRAYTNLLLANQEQFEYIHGSRVIHILKIVRHIHPRFV